VSQENVEIVKRIDALLHASDIDGALACFHPEVGWSAFGGDIDSLRFHFMPHENVLGVMILTPEVGEYIDRDAFVVCVAKDLRNADVYEFRDGKIIRAMFGLASKAEALKAVGLEE
jgi:ketosteroid isomerase-like protein